MVARSIPFFFLGTICSCLCIVVCLGCRFIYRIKGGNTYGVPEKADPAKKRQLPKVVGLSPRPAAGRVASLASERWRRSSAQSATAAGATGVPRTGCGDGAVAGAAPRAAAHLRHARDDPRWVLPLPLPRFPVSRPLVSCCLLVLLLLLDRVRAWRVAGMRSRIIEPVVGTVLPAFRLNTAPLGSIRGCYWKFYKIPAAFECWARNWVDWKQLHV